MGPGLRQDDSAVRTKNPGAWAGVYECDGTGD